MLSGISVGSPVGVMAVLVVTGAGVVSDVVWDWIPIKQQRKTLKTTRILQAPATMAAMLLHFWTKLKYNQCKNEIILENEIQVFVYKYPDNAKKKLVFTF